MSPVADHLLTEACIGPTMPSGTAAANEAVVNPFGRILRRDGHVAVWRGKPGFPETR